ncbi:MAG: hypothetical protein RLZZ553_1414 [Verrucomicrobiota bacterium]|jgi:hypothetical protein
MKYLLSRIAALAFAGTFACGQDAPELLTAFLKVDQPVRAEIVVVIPPSDIEKYISKVEQAAQKDPKWFAEYSKNTNPGVPLPFHEKLGITKQEYDEYLALWAKRELKPAQEVSLLLRKGSDQRWNIVASDSAAVVSSLRYSSQDDQWKSTNGIMSRLDDIKADANSILGEWSGKEWRFEEETSLSKIKENLAIGQTGDKKYHLIVYRAQELTSTGTRLLDKNIVIRVPAVVAVAPSTNAPTKGKSPTKSNQR